MFFQRKRRGVSMPPRNAWRAKMRTSYDPTNRSTDEMLQFPSQQEIDFQISKAKRAQTDHLHHLVVSAFAALDKRFHRMRPATN